MTPAAAHARFEEVVAKALMAPDPAAALARAARDRRLPAALRRALAGAQGDGVRLAALLVARLRFERLLRGSPDAEAWFEADPESFSATFQSYHHEVPPAAFFPPDEARLFRAWVAARVVSRRGPK